MKKLKIKSEKVKAFLESIKEKANLFAPQTDKYGDTYLQKVTDVNSVEIRHFKPLMPVVREVLFRQVEDMLKYSKKKGNTKVKNVDQSEETIIFGLPACDIEGILYCDNFFAKREYVDFYYKQARKKLTLISIGCITPPNETCFCKSMGHGPFSKKGFDIQLTDVGDGYFYAEAKGKKGESLASSDFFEAATAEDEVKVKGIKKQAEKLTKKKGLNKKKTLEEMGRKPLSVSEINDRCISCGGCNYVCPTCTCFNVIDLGDEKGGVRQRVLDSCIFAGYFRMAGGHNPKGVKNQRTNNRYFCKLIWDKEKFGDSGCVGCGRCLDSCPVEIDIKEVMKGGK